nr:uncharacterized protein LOC110146141 [Odocoileus virginianus texanus]
MRHRPPWGCSEAPVLTWPKDSSGDQEAEDQTAGGGRLRSHIPPPRGPPTESAPQEGASSPAPRARAPDAGGRGFSLTRRPLGCGAAPSRLRRPQLSTAQWPNSSRLPFHTRPRPLWLLLRGRRPSLSGRHLSNSERYTWFFLAGLLFSFSWNNNNGSGSVHKKPGARKELPGLATEGRQVQAVSSGGGGGGGSGGSESSGASGSLGCSEWRDWKACVSCRSPPPFALPLSSQLPASQEVQPSAGGRSGIRSLEALQDQVPG